MLRNVPAASEIIQAYHSFPASGHRPITYEIQKVLDEADKPKKGGKKRTKEGPSEPTQTPKKKVKRAAHKPRTPTPSDHGNSDSNTNSDIPVQHEIDETTETSHPMVLEHITTNPEYSSFPTCLYGYFATPSYSRAIHSFFIDSIATTTTPTSEPPVSVNTSDAVPGASGFTLGHDSTPIFGLRRMLLKKFALAFSLTIQSLTPQPSKIKKLHEDLLLENKTVDELAIKTQKSFIADVNALLFDIIETRDSLITIIVWKHLADKLRPMFAMLNRLEGVLASSTLPKQGGETNKLSTKETAKPVGSIEGSDAQKAKSNFEPKDNIALVSKGKEKVIDDGEEEEEYENIKLKCKARDAILDENLRIAREAKEKEKALRDTQITLKSKKLLFPPWSMERILTEAIDNPSIQCLELVTLFDLENTLDSQLDFPITTKVFLFRSFKVNLNTSGLDESVNKSVMTF
ncbi:unnamed protein product [Lactuca saligna]|uniref:Uncharacterized protein n=1 Tax=Lactuca saligna TaxID=75948 RepID=A0AA35YMI3_LACSI|nr:unnamed protein product [Lactuca saligna]